MLDLAGKTFSDMINNLNKVHVHVRATFPAGTKTPSIWATDITPESMVIHCITIAGEIERKREREIMEEENMRLRAQEIQRLRE